MNKLVIANSNKGGYGKSTVIKEVLKQLIAKYPANVVHIPTHGDVKAIITINGIKVGIESQGDPNSRMARSMDEFVAAECGIIVAACRTSGETYKKIDNELKNKGYDIIWASNDRYSDKSNKDIIGKLNDRYAKRIIQLIEDRIEGVI